MSTPVWWVEVRSVATERWHTGPFIPPGPPAEIAGAVRAHLRERRLDGAWPEEIRQMLLAVVEVYAPPLGTDAEALRGRSERPQDAQLVWHSDLTHEVIATVHAHPSAARLPVVNGCPRPKHRMTSVANPLENATPVDPQERAHMASLHKRHQPGRGDHAARPPSMRLTTDGVLSWLWGIGSGVTLAAIGFLAASEHADPASGNALAPPVSQPDPNLAAEEAGSP